VDAEKYRFDTAKRRELRSSLGILTRRLVAKNGVIHLARATRFLDEPRLRFLLIGDGPEYNAVSACLEEHFSNRFSMLGAMRHDQIIP
jgi:hypothetical protein